MEYRGHDTPAQAFEPDLDDASAPPVVAPPPPFSGANINPITGLASDYLNHFNEAIMLLELVTTCPDCRADFQNWRAMSYHEHFQHTQFTARDVAIAAYDAAEPATRDRLDRLATMMTAVIETARAAMMSDPSPAAAAITAERATAWLKVLVARAGSVINGEIDLARPALPHGAARVVG